jgi:predicted nucleic acid-binding protein
MSVFADTSSLYAAIVHSEERHRDCAALIMELLETGRTIRTTSYVVLETAALLQHRIGLRPVRDFDERILPLMTVCWVSGDLHRRGMRRLLREDKRTLSLTDCVSFEFMESEGLRDVFSLDRHFAEAGFRLLQENRLRG